MIEWLYCDEVEVEVPSPQATAVLLHFGQAYPERVPLWAAHWLAAGYDGDHLAHLAGLRGDDPREVHDALPGALRDCGVRPPDSDEAAAGDVFARLARRHLDGTAGAGQVLGVVGSVLAWCGYPEAVMDLPLGRLVLLEDEWDENWGRHRKQVAAVVRDACQEQLAPASAPRDRVLLPGWLSRIWA